MKTYKVTEGTSALLGAVQSLNDSKNVILDALTTVYGEEQAQQMFDRIPFADVEDCLQKYLYLSITENLAEMQGGVTRI